MIRDWMFSSAMEECMFLPLLFNFVLEPSQCNQTRTQKKKEKTKHTDLKKKKLSLFTDNIFVYVKRAPQNLPKKAPKLIRLASWQEARIPYLEFNHIPI